jgi:hypothetical protein
MVTISFALSVHHFISSVGADAGFAAFIAVALLVLLFFSQARETATLRRRADEAGQRVEELESQLYALSEQVAALPPEISVRAASPRAAAAYGARAPAPAPAGAGAPGLNLPPAAPAGVGGPALAAATRLIPDALRPLGEQAPATVGLANGPVDDITEIHASPAALAGGNGSPPRPVAAPAATMQRLPVQARPGGPARPAGGPPRGAQGHPAGGHGRSAGDQGRPGGPPPAVMAMRPGERQSRPGWVFAVLAVLLAVGAVVAGVLVISNLNHATSQSNRSAAASRSTLASQRTTPVVVVKPSTVTVSVLNGTDQSGLAGRLSSKLAADGYKQGAVTNASDQTHTTTIVQYPPRDRVDALAVATSLKLGRASVQPIDSATQHIVCSVSPLGCSSPVVVTVGSDLASFATQ